MRSRSLAVVLFVSLAFIPGSSRTTAQNSANGPQLVAGEVIVKYRVGTTAAEKTRAMGRANGRSIERLSRTPAAAASGDVELLAIGGGVNVGAAIARLSQDPSVVFAEPNWIYTADQAAPTDPSYGQLWGLNNTGQDIAGQGRSTPDADIDAPEAWGVTTGSVPPVAVGVIDEGIAFDHPDLAGQIWTNPFDPIDGTDNDGNGYVDDVHGWDFANGDNTVYDGTSKNSVDAHGTHVAGTIGAIANNGTGVVGVNWNIAIISAKFLGRRGGTTANAIKAFDYITDLKIRHGFEGLNIVATNNSWGGGGFSQALLEAIARGASHDIIALAAAGNGDRRGNGINNDVSPHYPSSYSTAAIAGYDAVISVAATGRDDELRPWSNYGVASVDLGAPGSLILSTVPGGGYDYYSGTSMATPHVTGVAALVNSALGLVGQNLRNKILGSVDPNTALAGKTTTEGRLNAYAAVTPDTP